MWLHMIKIELLEKSNIKGRVIHAPDTRIHEWCTDEGLADNSWCSSRLHGTYIIKPVYLAWPSKMREPHVPTLGSFQLRGGPKSIDVQGRIFHMRKSSRAYIRYLTIYVNVSR